ncbi:hypothetical protein SO802_015823 [Lithocarpus litseifolius]|uniref:RNase H type-1 domain-containing protein n=1 Tax=Lithocarpus litseifolius TaxID=425828 RepID=A0AAW2CX24_9ROSI
MDRGILTTISCGGFEERKEGGSVDWQTPLASDSMDKEEEQVGLPMTIQIQNQNLAHPKNTRPGQEGVLVKPSIKSPARNPKKGEKDLGYCGPDYTQCNMKERSNRVSLCLDRVFANFEWLGHFKEPIAHHLAESTSDHYILAITDSPPLTSKGNRRFHFEAIWKDCREVIKDAWKSGTLSTTPEGVASNLQQCANALASWNQNVVGNIPKKIAEKRRVINSITTEDRQGDREAEINQLRKEINDLLDSEETIWRQHSRVHWYREGDRNTKFFHARASERRKKNTILGLWNDDGIWCDSKESNTATTISYFEKIDTTSFPTGINVVISAIPRRSNPSYAWRSIHNSLEVIRKGTSKVMAEYKVACPYLVLPQAPPLSNWKAPPLGFFKVNIDATASDDERKSCIGVVIRGSKGEILATSSKVFPVSFTAEISKVVAVLEGVLLAAKMEVTHAIIKSDALSIIQAINDGVFGGELNHNIQNIREAASFLGWCSFCHLKKEGNKVAHELARVARITDVSQVWERTFPSLVEHLIIEELFL